MEQNTDEYTHYDTVPNECLEDVQTRLRDVEPAAQCGVIDQRSRVNDICHKGLKESYNVEHPVLYIPL